MTVSSRPTLSALKLACLAGLAIAGTTLAPLDAAAQDAPPAAGPRATARITVQHDGAPVPGVRVRALIDPTAATPDTVSALTDARGTATLQVTPGARAFLSTRVGFRPDTLRAQLVANQDTSFVVTIEALHTELTGMVVSATRSERRVEDTPLRVEVIDEEEIAEKVAMTPGDIAMMLNETSGLRVQTTNPSLGGANVRVQGLRGRYTLILADGLPLYGGQAGGLGLLQIPPVDLGRVEVIKGTASALYGSSALGGVINLVSRRPADDPERTILLNQTSRGGSDAVYFGSGRPADGVGYTLLAGAHRQSRRDLDTDGWTDLPGYERFVVRPRLYLDNGRGRSAFLTTGVTVEDRTGGTVPGATVPGGGSFGESLRTRRGDVGGLLRWTLGDGTGEDTDSDARPAVLSLRASAMQQRHDHVMGAQSEKDNHGTWFAEATIAKPTNRAVYVAGVAAQQDRYRNTTFGAFDYTFTAPAAFLQADVDATRWLSLSTTARVDFHSHYGTVFNPRVSMLLRAPDVPTLDGWTARFSAGTGAFAPTPFTEETEATGLAPLRPLGPLSAERAGGGSIDIGGPVRTGWGQLDLNATAFGSRVTSALQVRDAGGTTPNGATRIELINSAAPTRTWGGELLARFTRPLGGEGDAHDDDAPTANANSHENARKDTPREVHDDEHGEGAVWRTTASVTVLRATECAPEQSLGRCVRRDVPLTPRASAGLVSAVEWEGVQRVGLEVYYTGQQSLEENPYRQTSRPYVIVGLLGERVFKTPMGAMRVFVNLENITNVRQTRFDPLRLPTRGMGGRWATDAWTDLVGFTTNAGIRLSL
ncbi:MAG TPA: TonB-dependent receptor plug domain-containing protein [Gemmatimonas sp.]|uniref:TonB-dependent receptor plug domain-containing protein n=1 Tax=Gemmatimonas sp. TaxID=1962908 RepID=UPI002EDB528F